MGPRPRSSREFSRRLAANTMNTISYLTKVAKKKRKSTHIDFLEKPIGINFLLET